MRKSFFNLIEVTMAIAVVGIGIAGIMALLPPAVEANKSADYNNYLGDVVSTLASYYEAELKREWRTSTDTRIILEAKPDLNNSDKYKAWKKDVIFEPGKDTWTAIPNLNGIYKVEKDDKKYFGISSADDRVKAIVYVWQETPTKLTYVNRSGSENNPAPTDPERLKVTFELSWPAMVDHANRQKRYYVYEFNKE